MPLQKLSQVAELEKLLLEERKIKLYGAGHYLNLFLQGVEEIERAYLRKIVCIMVTDAQINPKQIKGIPVNAYHTVALKPDDCVILTLGNRYTEEIYDHLKETGANVIELDFNMFQRAAYEEVLESVRPFVEAFPTHHAMLPKPVCEGKITAWTCWWQGTEQAPELVKSCWETQRRNLPEGVRHVIITEENFREYIELPKYLLMKVKMGDIMLAHLADIIRVLLLYQYGGFWLDATVFLLEPLSKSILDYPIYTRNLPEVQFCANTMWTIGFLYAKPGNKLFRFCAEGFFYYFTRQNRLKYYFTLDYLIAIACNIFPEIEEQLQQIPYNNEGAFELRRHLTEPFDERKYREYIKGNSLQILTYKVNWASAEAKELSIYSYMVHKGMQADRK